MKAKWLHWGLSLIAVFLFLTAVRFIFSGKPQSGRVDPVLQPASAPKNQAQVVAGSGVVEPSSELVGIASPIAGIVSQVLVKPGQQVKQNEVLFVLDQREILAEIAARTAMVSTMEQMLVNARIDERDKAAALQRYEAIGDEAAMIQEELQQRRFAAQLAQARVELAKAQLREAQEKLKQAIAQQDLHFVRAPFAASVLQVKVRPGQFAPANIINEPLLTLGRTDPLYVRVDIDESDIGRLVLGASASVSVRGSPNRRTEASFVRVEPLVVPKRSLTNAASERVDTRVLQVLYALPKQASGFYIGQQIDAFISASDSVSPH